MLSLRHPRRSGRRYRQCAQFTGSGFIHSGSQPMSVPEYLPRELFEDTATSGDAAPKIKLDGFEPNM